MQKAIKILASLIGLVILLALAGIVYLVAFVNPNDFKSQISAKVAAATGRQFVINGDIKWSFFPWIGLQVNQATLSNAPSFSALPFMQVARADIKVEAVPLLSGNIKVGKLSLEGLQLNLMKNAKGATNWQDLTDHINAQKNAAQNSDNNNLASANTSTKTKHQFNFAIEGIALNGGAVSWQDAQKNQDIKITGLAVSTGKLAPGAPFPLAIRFTINSSQPAISGNFSLASDVSGDLAKRSYTFNHLKLTSALNNNAYQNGKLTLALQAEKVSADLLNETLTINSLNAQVANLQVQGNLQGSHILSNVQINGQIKIPSFNLKQLLAALGRPLPPRQDANALSLVAASANLQATENSVKLSQLVAQLDGANINGSLAVNDFTKKALVYSFNLDQINLDNYLAATPATKTASNGSATAPAATPPAQNKQPLLPLDTLRQLTMQGRLQIGKLHLNKLDASAITMQLTAQNGLINVAPLSAKLYQGNYNGSIKLDVRNNTPVITADNALTGIQVQQLAQDLTNITKLQMTGAGNLGLHIATQGNTESAIIQRLNGNGRLSLTNGVIQGINIPYYVGVGRALIKGNALPVQGANQTKFGNLTSTFTIVNGLVNNNDLLINAPTFQAKGSGSANLITQYLNYRLLIQLLVTGTQQTQGDPIPVNIHGSFANLSIQPDVQALIKQQAAKQIQTRVTSELQKRLGNQTGEQVGKAINYFIQQLRQ